MEEPELIINLGIDLCEFRKDADVARAQAKYVKYFLNPPGPVVDLGCGRGILLGLLKEAGIPAYGVECFAPALAECRRRGVEVVEDKAQDHLKGLPSESVGGIFCSHLIEHLHPSTVISLIRDASRVLRPRGTLVLITPNPKDLNVLTEIFWLDVTHVRFYPGRLLQAILARAGFSKITVFEDKDTRWSKSSIRMVAGLIRKLWLWGFTNRGDVVVVARK